MRRPLLHVVIGAALVAGLSACSADGEEPRVAGAVEVASPSASASASEGAQGEDASASPAGEAPAAPDAGPPTADPVPFDAPADFGTGVTAEVVEVEAIEAEGRGPGERSGPALAFRVEVTNGSSEPVDLDTVTVNVADAEGAPGVPLFGPPARPFTGTVAPGEAVEGTYVFLVDPETRDELALEVSYSTDASVVVFAGDPAGEKRRS